MSAAGLPEQLYGCTDDCVAWRGADGFGKTTLALALCHDTAIQAAFPDGILWVALGERPGEPREMLGARLVALEPGQMAASTLEEGRAHWQTAILEWRGLLLIDDVWRAEVLAPLLEGNSLCTCLITTRNDQILPEGVVRIPVDAMEPAKASTLLGQRFSERLSIEAAQPHVERLARRPGHRRHAG